jgi:hypothetical protein
MNPSRSELKRMCLLAPLKAARSWFTLHLGCRRKHWWTVSRGTWNRNKRRLRAGTRRRSGRAVARCGTAQRTFRFEQKNPPHRDSTRGKEQETRNALKSVSNRHAMTRSSECHAQIKSAKHTSAQEQASSQRYSATKRQLQHMPVVRPNQNSAESSSA